MSKYSVGKRIQSCQEAELNAISDLEPVSPLSTTTESPDSPGPVDCSNQERPKTPTTKLAVRADQEQSDLESKKEGGKSSEPLAATEGEEEPVALIRVTPSVEKKEKALQADVKTTEAEPRQSSKEVMTQVAGAMVASNDDLTCRSTHQSQLLTFHKTMVGEGRRIKVTDSEWGRIVIKRSAGGSLIALTDKNQTGPRALGHVKLLSDDSDSDPMEAQVSVDEETDVEADTDDEFDFAKIEERSETRFRDTDSLCWNSVVAVLNDSLCQAILGELLDGGVAGKMADKDGHTLNDSERHRVAKMVAGMSYKLAKDYTCPGDQDSEEILFVDLVESLALHLNPPLRLDVDRELPTAHCGTFRVSNGVATGTAVVGEVIRMDARRAKRAKMEDEWDGDDSSKGKGPAERKRAIKLVMGLTNVDRHAAKTSLKHNKWDELKAVIGLTPSTI